jgi:hypothetical protein
VSDKILKRLIWYNGHGIISLTLAETLKALREAGM